MFSQHIILYLLYFSLIFKHLCTFVMYIIVPFAFSITLKTKITNHYFRNKNICLNDAQANIRVHIRGKLHMQVSISEQKYLLNAKALLIPCLTIHSIRWHLPSICHILPILLWIPINLAPLSPLTVLHLWI